MKIIDISQELTSCNVYPGDPVPEVKRVYSMDNGECYNLSYFSMCAHNGTHIDAPCHFINNGNSVDMIPLESFVGDCYVICHEGDFGEEDAKNALKKASSYGADTRILIKGKATVTEAAAGIFAKEGIKLLGNEGQTIGPEASPMNVHLILLDADIVLLEGIVLKDVKEGKYFLSAAPLNISDCDGAPCRAYLIEQ